MNDFEQILTKIYFENDGETDLLTGALAPARFNQLVKREIDLISLANVSGKQIHINDFHCNLFEVNAEISIMGRLPIDIPFQGMSNPKSIEITATVGANSPYQLP